MMEHSGHTATDAKTPVYTQKHPTFKPWLHDPVFAAAQIKHFDKVQAHSLYPHIHKSLTWMRGLLMHGYGFTEQVLAKSNHHGSGHTGTLRLNGSCCHFTRGETGYVALSPIGKPAPTNPVASPSTSAPTTEPLPFYGSAQLKGYGQPPWWAPSP
jgi:hypothetical protein